MSRAVPVGSVWELLRQGEQLCLALVTRTDEDGLVYGLVLRDDSSPDELGTVVGLSHVDRMLDRRERGGFEWRRVS